MKKANYIFLLAAFVCLAASGAFAQTKTDERRVVEVTGSAEMLIMPNEFTFRIVLTERIENKQKLTIEMQETRLKEELAKIGVDVQKDLSVFDMTSVYIARKRTKDTLASKIYSLKLRDLNKIERLQEIADNLNIAALDLVETTHSDLIAFRKQTKIEATKAAKMKAEYMLAAVGEKIGQTVYVKEIEDNYSDNLLPSNNRVNSNFSTGLLSGDSQQVGGGLSFSKIKIRYSVLARFEIQ